jgi:hypothetical protein
MPSCHHVDFRALELPRRQTAHMQKVSVRAGLRAVASELDLYFRLGLGSLILCRPSTRHEFPARRMCGRDGGLAVFPCELPPGPSRGAPVRRLASSPPLGA